MGMKYLSVLGRQPEISLAELSALFQQVEQVSPLLATFESEALPDINRLGGSLKLAQKLDTPLVDYLAALPDGKLTIGLSNYGKKATARSTSADAMKLKKALKKRGRSVRIVQGKAAVLSTATSHHNHLGSRERAVEIIKFGGDIYLSTGTQDITAYARRDQARPARDAKVGMLPPKLAQILINLCGPLPAGARVLDPFCGTGVVLQEAYLMGYTPYGTDADPRMIEYTKKNLAWLQQAVSGKTAEASILGSPRQGSNTKQGGGSREGDSRARAGDTRQGTPARAAIAFAPWDAGAKRRTMGIGVGQDPRSATGARDGINEPCQIELGDATTFSWRPPIAAVASEAYLGQPMSAPPAEIKLKQEQQKCKELIVGFLKNLQGQLAPGTPVVLAIPAWLRPDGHYSKLNLLDDLAQMEYNRIKELGFDDLLYYREGQIVARNIIVLRKK